MQQEHPFAEYIRILGKGRNGSRGLTEAEAEKSMAMILADEVEPAQLGAFLMLMRVKEETPPELAGAVRAVRRHLQLPTDLPPVDLDWSSYAGKRRQPPWYLLAALLLARNGVRLFMHGASGHTAGRIYTKDVLPALGVPVASSLAEAARQIEAGNFAYLDIENLCPKLHQIIEMRPLLGLRSPVHTIARLMNPFSAPCVLQGIFHPGYQPTHQQAGAMLNQPHLAVIKGEGGEIERNPDMSCTIQAVHEGEMQDEEWPPMFAKRHKKPDSPAADALLPLWRGDTKDEYAEGAVIGTMAIALYVMGRADSRESAEQMARNMWQQRDPGQIGLAA